MLMLERRSGPRAGALLGAALLALPLLAPPAGAAPTAPYTPGVESARALGRSFAAVARSAYPAVVFVRTEKEVGGNPLIRPGPDGDAEPHPQNPLDLFGRELFERFFRHRAPRGRMAPPGRKVQGQGSGFLVSADGYILTNNHVVQGADAVKVTLSDDREVVAEVVGTDPPSDVAVLKVEVAEPLPYLTLGDSDSLEVGQWVLAVGNPFGLTHTMTAGIVSALSRNRMGITDYEDFIQTDAAINPGNSGGPLLDLEGKVVGINTAIFSRSGGYMGIGFSIPIEMARSIYQQIRENGEVRRGFLGVGIQDLTEDLAATLDLEGTEGILIGSVQDGSAADEAGLEVGDVIVKMNGEDVEDVAEFRNAVALLAPGTRIRLLVERDGGTKVLWATLGERPDAPAGAPASAPTEATLMETLGLSVRVAEEGAGLRIEAVRPGSAAAQAGLEEGAHILEASRKPLRSPEDLRRAVEEAQGAGRILLRVRQGPLSRFVVLPLSG